jgi:trigger factor
LRGLRDQVRASLKARRSAEPGDPAPRSPRRLPIGSNFEPPASLVEAETQGVLRQFIEENMRRGVPAEQFEKDKKELFEGARKAAASASRSSSSWQGSPRPRKSRSPSGTSTFSSAGGGPLKPEPEKVAKELAKDRDALRSVQQSIIFDKSVDFLVSKASLSPAQS